MSLENIPSGTPAVVNVSTPGSTPPPATPTADWTSGFNEDIKGYVSNKGFKDPASVVESYRNMEKLIGVPQERVLKLPEKEDAPEWQDIYNRLGRPKDAKEYGLKAPTEGTGKEFIEAAASEFYKLGMTKNQATKITEWWNGQMQSRVTAQKEAETLAAKDAVTNLKKEWGQAYDQNLNVVDTVANGLGLTEAHLSKLKAAFGPADAIKFLHTLGTKTQFGEHAFVEGKTGGVLSPSGAAAKIKELQSDADFRRRLLANDTATKAEWDRLHLMLQTN